MFAPVHLIFDLIAYTVAVMLAVVFRRRLNPRGVPVVPADQSLMYLFVLTNGAIAGSLLFGSLNLVLSDHAGTIGKSIIGAIVGGIIAVESFKLARGLRGSTGAALVPGLALGIAIGRLGCFFAGLSDFTYGVPSAPLPGVDFGDGIARHPVQLYEAALMLSLFAVATTKLWRGSEAWWRNSFYYFAIVYGAQRWLWEFLKPYPTVFLGLTVFQLLCIALIIYGATMLRRTGSEISASQPA